MAIKVIQDLLSSNPCYETLITLCFFRTILFNIFEVHAPFRELLGNSCTLATKLKSYVLGCTTQHTFGAVSAYLGVMAANIEILQESPGFDLDPVRNCIFRFLG